MTSTLSYPTATTASAPAVSNRFRLLGAACVQMFTWPVATVLFCVWITVVCLSPVTLFLPLVLPVTRVVRRYADVHRRWAGRILGAPISRPYRAAAGRSWLPRTRAVLADRASWREWWWLLMHSTVGVFLSTLSVTLFAGTLFYLSYPFLYWVTPHNVFGKPFGHYDLHSVGQSCVMLPLALVSFGLWYATARPFARVSARLARGLLGPAREPLA